MSPESGSSQIGPPSVGAGFKPALTRSGTEQSGRKPIRLQGFDYSTPGAYFITVCSFQRRLLFESSALRGAVEETWKSLSAHYADIELDAFVVMPNHVHGIVFLQESSSNSLTEVVRGFKTFSARRVNLARGTPGIPVWQRNYYEHAIRSESSLAAIQEYIADNPRRWDEDHENPRADVTPAERGFWRWIRGEGSLPVRPRAGLKPAPTASAQVQNR